MDIHKPKPAHSLREFLVEIGTITIGILIALGLEGLVENHRNHELVERARESLRDELRRNRQELLEVTGAARSSEDTLKTLIAYGENRLANAPQPFPAHLRLNGDFATLGTSGWESTVATQAFAHMPYDQAQVLAEVYAESRSFNTLEEQIEGRWFDLAAFGSHPERMSNAEVAKAVADLRVDLSYQVSVAATGAVLLKTYDTALRALGR